MRPLPVQFACLIMTFAAMQAQDYTYSIADNAVTITRYNGPDGDVIIPETLGGLPVVSIGDFAFENRTNVTGVGIASTVTNIGEGAFSFCTILPSAVIPDSVTRIGGSAFAFCGNLTNVAISGSVATIGDFAFENCKGLVSVTISDGVRSIGEGAFQDCSRLAYVALGSGVTNLGAFAFYSCEGLDAFSVSALNQSYQSVEGVLFDGAGTILIRYPEAKSGNYTVPTNVIRIADAAFSGCKQLSEVSMSDSVRFIGEDAFEYCSGLTNAIIGNGVVSVGDGAFSFCTNLIAVRIGANVTNIGVDAFEFCARLSQARVPASVIQIGDDAFSFGLNLRQLTIGKRIVRVGTAAFSDCANLDRVYFEGAAPTVGEAPFLYSSNAIILHLPSAAGWLAAWGGRSTAIWLPEILVSGGSLGSPTNGFALDMTWADGRTVVVEAATNAAQSKWITLRTNSFAGNTWHFDDSDWTNHPARFYRLRELQ